MRFTLGVPHLVSFTAVRHSGQPRRERAGITRQGRGRAEPDGNGNSKGGENTRSPHRAHRGNAARNKTIFREHWTRTLEETAPKRPPSRIKLAE